MRARRTKRTTGHACDGPSGTASSTHRGRRGDVGLKPQIPPPYERGLPRRLVPRVESCVHRWQRMESRMPLPSFAGSSSSASSSFSPSLSHPPSKRATRARGDSLWPSGLGESLGVGGELSIPPGEEEEWMVAIAAALRDEEEEGSRGEDVDLVVLGQRNTGIAKQGAKVTGKGKEKGKEKVVDLERDEDDEVWAMVQRGFDSEWGGELAPSQGRLGQMEPGAVAEAAAAAEVAEAVEEFPDLVSLFCHYNEVYFEGLLHRCVVEWSSPRMTLCAGQCGFDGAVCTIRLSEPLLKFRPLSDMKNTLLHEMIHAFVFLHCPSHTHEDHGPMFQSHMDRINQSTVPDHQRPPTGYEVTVFHSFTSEVDHYRTHHWTCARCGRVVKRAMNRPPSEADCYSKRFQSRPRAPAPLPTPARVPAASGSRGSSSSRASDGAKSGRGGGIGNSSGHGRAAREQSAGAGASVGVAGVGSGGGVGVPKCRHPSCSWHRHLQLCGGMFVKTAEPPAAAATAAGKGMPSKRARKQRETAAERRQNRIVDFVGVADSCSGGHAPSHHPGVADGLQRGVRGKQVEHGSGAQIALGKEAGRIHSIDKYFKPMGSTCKKP